MERSARFCPACGTAAPEPVPLPVARATAAAASPIFAIGFAAGCALALLATFLPWVSISRGKFFVNGWHPLAFFQVSDWFGVRQGRWDAIVVVLLAVAGLALVPPLLRGLGIAFDIAAAAAGGLILLSGLIEIRYIHAQLPKGVSVGIGVYLLVVAGLVATGCAVAGAVQRRRA